MWGGATVRADAETYLSPLALPDDYCSLLSTMRSREISSIIIIQNLAQIKALFKDTWETIPGNCDTLIYLGGNEQSTHKYTSELMGKGTIDKKSSGETKGRQGSSSRNYDVLGRELLTPDEVRKLDNKECLIFIRGFDPIMDRKYIPFGHASFGQTADGKGKPYEHAVRSGAASGPVLELLNPEAVRYYELLKAKGEAVYIDCLSYEEFSLLTGNDLRKKRFLDLDEGNQKESVQPDDGYELEYTPEISEKHEAAKKEGEDNGKGFVGADTIMNRMLQWKYSDEQKEELKRMMECGMPTEDILCIFYPGTTVEQLKGAREAFLSIKKGES